jgi:hypothetical protein
MAVGADEDQAGAVYSAERQTPARHALDVVECTRLGLQGDPVDHDQAGISLGEIVDGVVGPVGGCAGEQEVERRSCATALQRRGSGVEMERRVGEAVAGARSSPRSAAVVGDDGAAPVGDGELGHRT